MNEGYFIGRSSLLSCDKSVKIWGMRVANGIARTGKTIFLNNKLVGEVTSSSWSPYQECGVSLIRFYEAPEVSENIILDVLDNKNKKLKGHICKLPMYDSKGEIVRGINRKFPQKPDPWDGK